MPLKIDSPIIYVRGIPMQTQRVIDIQDELGAQLFDESCFQNDPVKLAACRDMLNALDMEARRYWETHGTFPEQVVIPGSTWVYIPAPVFKPDPGSIIQRTNKNMPAGALGWFRRKKIWRAPNWNH